MRMWRGRGKNDSSNKASWFYLKELIGIVMLSRHQKNTLLDIKINPVFAVFVAKIFNVLSF